MYLNTHSYYSLRHGTLPVETLVEEYKKEGYQAIALTDINNSTGVLPFVKICDKERIKPIAGMELRDENYQLLYVGIARNNKGFKELNDLITNRNLDGIPLPVRPELLHCYLIYPYHSHPEILKENEFIGIKPEELKKISFQSKSFLNKCVAFPSLVFMDDNGFELHKQLRAIDNNTLISKLRDEQFARKEDKFLTMNEFLNVYKSFPELIKNVNRIIDECSFEFDFKKIKNKQTFTGNRYEDKFLLEKLAFEGMKSRYGSDNDEAERRIRSELEIIDKLDFASYFLIAWDIIQYSMSRKFYHVGRGSCANSIVAYCLKITDVCPIELDLYFERFLNPQRKSPPDMDIDYSWKDRDDVHNYIFKKYGREHTALLGTISTFRDKSILRELGKVYGLPKNEIDQLINLSDNIKENEISDKIYQLRELVVKDFPNIRSIHAGGVLISEEPITNYTALDLPPKGFPTVQFDMYIAEDIGFEKLDILSQRGIGHINDSVEIILKNKGVKIDVHQVGEFKMDEKVKQQLKDANTIGCFYIESPAMRGLLKKLECDNYLSLVAASSIIRPGVASSGMMREYIYRFHHSKDFKYLHPIMEEQLEETYGVMIYQEDVLKVCHHFGGLDLSDADVLRRMMSGKKRDDDKFHPIVKKFFSNCKAFGYPDELAHEVWRQIESFAGYSFSKAHSASYAVESFQSLYLKSHYPMEFMVAVINNFGGFYNTRVYVNEARKSGADIHTPCVNKSLYTTTIYGKDIYLGFIHIQSMESYFAKLIPEERERNGNYTSLENFVSRTGITIEQMIILVRINAFKFLGKSKKELLWEVHILFKNNVKATTKQLIESPAKDFKFPVFEDSKAEDMYDEYELIGFPVTFPDFDLLKTTFRGEINAKELINHVGKKVRMVGSYVAIKNVRTKRNELMNFGTFFDSEGNFFDTTHFPDSLKHYPFQGKGLYLILGKVVEEFGFASLEVEKMAKLPVVADPRSL